MEPLVLRIPASGVCKVSRNFALDKFSGKYRFDLQVVSGTLSLFASQPPSSVSYFDHIWC